MKIKYIISILLFNTSFLNAQAKIEAFNLSVPPFSINGYAMDFALEKSATPVFLVSPREYDISINYNKTNSFEINKSINNQRVNFKINAPVSEYLYFFPYGKIFINESDEIFLFPISIKDDKDVWSDYTVINKDLTTIYHSRYSDQKLESLKSQYPTTIFNKQSNFIRFRSSSTFSNGLFGSTVYSGYGGNQGGSTYTKLLPNNQLELKYLEIKDGPNEIHEPLKTMIDANSNVWSIYKGRETAGLITTKQTKYSTNFKALNIENSYYSDNSPYFILPCLDNNSVIIIAGSEHSVFKYDGNEIHKITNINETGNELVEPVLDINDKLWVVNNSTKILTSYDTKTFEKKYDIDVSKYPNVKKIVYDKVNACLLLLLNNNVLLKIVDKNIPKGTPSALSLNPTLSIIEKITLAKSYQEEGKDLLALALFQEVATTSSNENFYPNIHDILYKNKKYFEASNATLKSINWKKDRNERVSGNDYLTLARDCYFNAQSMLLTSNSTKEDTLKKELWGKRADEAIVNLMEINSDYLPAHLWRARAHAMMDTDRSKGLAIPFYLKYVDLADKVKNRTELKESYLYIAFHNLIYSPKKNVILGNEFLNKVLEIEPENDHVKRYRELAK